MSLTNEQALALKASINANPALASLALTAASASEIAAVYNAPAVPPYHVYKTYLEISEIMNNGFDWTRVDNATVGKARIWEWMTAQGSINPSKPNVRAGINEAWAGTGAEQVAHRNAINAHLYRPATVAEKLFTTGVGTTVAPSLLVVDGELSASDVQAAREL